MKRSIKKAPFATLSSRHIQTEEYRRVELDDAREELPLVRRLTARSAEQLLPIQQRLEKMVPADPRRVELSLEYERIVLSWTGKIERLGLLGMGLWQVGFDNGQGWYVWQYPERSIRFFVEYGSLFSERKLIADDMCRLDNRLIKKL